MAQSGESNLSGATHLPFPVGQTYHDAVPDATWVTVSLLVCVILAVAGLAWLKRRQVMGGNPRRAITIIERLSLSRQQELVLLEIRGQEILLSHGADGVRVIDASSTFLRNDVTTQEHGDA